MKRQRSPSPSEASSSGSSCNHNVADAAAVVDDGETGCVGQHEVITTPILTVRVRNMTPEQRLQLEKGVRLSLTSSIPPEPAGPSPDAVADADAEADPTRRPSAAGTSNTGATSNGKRVRGTIEYAAVVPSNDDKREFQYYDRYVIDKTGRRGPDNAAHQHLDDTPVYHPPGPYALGDDDYHNLITERTCFNCDESGHELSQCPYPRDEAKIKQRRAVFTSEQGARMGGRYPVGRYHARNNVDVQGIRPGNISTALAQALGMSSTSAPPPFIRAMRMWGMPPGYDIPPSVAARQGMEDTGAGVTGLETHSKQEEGQDKDDEVALSSSTALPVGEEGRDKDVVYHGDGRESNDHADQEDGAPTAGTTPTTTLPKRSTSIIAAIPGLSVPPPPTADIEEWSRALRIDISRVDPSFYTPPRFNPQRVHYMATLGFQPFRIHHAARPHEPAATAAPVARLHPTMPQHMPSAGPSVPPYTPAHPYPHPYPYHHQQRQQQQQQQGRLHPLALPGTAGPQGAHRRGMIPPPSPTMGWGQRGHILCPPPAPSQALGHPPSTPVPPPVPPPVAPSGLSPAPHAMPPNSEIDMDTGD